MLCMQKDQQNTVQHTIAEAILQLCAISSPPLRSAQLVTQSSFAGASVSQPDAAGMEDELLCMRLVELGAVPHLLRLHSLSYSRPLREGARRVLRPLLRLHGNAVRSAAKDIIITQPMGTSPAVWIEWQQQFEQDLYGDVAMALAILI